MRTRMHTNTHCWWSETCSYSKMLVGAAAAAFGQNMNSSCNVTRWKTSSLHFQRIPWLQKTNKKYNQTETVSNQPNVHLIPKKNILTREITKCAFRWVGWSSRRNNSKLLSLLLNWFSARYYVVFKINRYKIKQNTSELFLNSLFNVHCKSVIKKYIFLL